MGAGPHRRPVSVRLPHVRQLLVTRPVGGHEDDLRIFGTRGAIGVPQHRCEHSARRAPGSEECNKVCNLVHTFLNNDYQWAEKYSAIADLPRSAEETDTDDPSAFMSDSDQRVSILKMQLNNEHLLS